MSHGTHNMPLTLFSFPITLVVLTLGRYSKYLSNQLYFPPVPQKNRDNYYLGFSPWRTDCFLTPTSSPLHLLFVCKPLTAGLLV